MQLKRKALSAATAALLGTVGATNAAEPGWSFDAATLVYSETGGRVQAFEPKFRATRDLGDERSYSFGLTLDVLTGASPNGAAPFSGIQTFTNPSGNGQYTAAPGETPLDDNFKDTRVAIDGAYSAPLTELLRWSGSLGVSKEYDYLSLYGGATLSRDFNQRNTTVAFGLNVEAASINPDGGVPTPLTPMNAPGTRAGAKDSDTKQVFDALLSVTQVLSAKSLGVFGYSLSQSSGYLTDPFKLLSVVDDITADPTTVAPSYIFEKRPDSRIKHAIYAQYKYFAFDRDVFDVSLRLMTDDWGIASQTLDTTYRWNFAENQYLEPHLRYYQQSEADFYRVALADGEENTVEFASADQRLGQFDAITAGLKYGRTLEGGNSWSVRLEGYTQAGKVAGLPADATTAAALQQFDLKPELSAAMLTFGFRWR